MANIGHSVSEETRQKISKANKGKINFRKGANLTEFHKKNISEAKKNKSFTDEHKQHLSESHSTDAYKQNIRENLGIKIQCIETGSIFNSYTEAAEWCGLKASSSIGDYLKGNKKVLVNIQKLEKNYIGRKYKEKKYEG